MSKFAAATAKLGEVNWEDLKAKYLPTLASGLAGATIAGGGMALASSRRPDESDEEFKARRLNAALGGALAGGVVGAAAPTVADLLGGLSGNEVAPHRSPEDQPNLLDRSVAAGDIATSTPVTSIAGATGAALTAIPIQKKITGGLGDIIDGLPARLKNLRVTYAGNAAAGQAARGRAVATARLADKALIPARGIAPLAIAGGATLLPLLINKIKSTAGDGLFVQPQS